MHTQIHHHLVRREYDVYVDDQYVTSCPTRLEAELFANDARYRDLHCCAYPCRSLMAPMAALDAQALLTQYRGFAEDETRTRSLVQDRAVEWIALGWRYRAQSDDWTWSRSTQQVFRTLYRELASELAWSGGRVTRCTLACLWQQTYSEITGTTPDVDSADVVAVRPRQVLIVAAMYADVHQKQMICDLTHGHLTFS